jgi:hypothetical protein
VLLWSNWRALPETGLTRQADRQGSCDHAWQASENDPCLMGVQSVEWLAKHISDGKRITDYDKLLTKAGILNRPASASQPGRWTYGKCSNEAVLFIGPGDDAEGTMWYFDAATKDFLAVRTYWPGGPLNPCGGRYFWPVRFDPQSWTR